MNLFVPAKHWLKLKESKKEKVPKHWLRIEKKKKKKRVHNCDSGTNYSWNTRNDPEELEIGLKELVTQGRIKTVQTLALSNFKESPDKT